MHTWYFPRSQLLKQLRCARGHGKARRYNALMCAVNLRHLDLDLPVGSFSIAWNVEYDNAVQVAGCKAIWFFEKSLGNGGEGAPKPKQWVAIRKILRHHRRRARTGLAFVLFRSE